MHPNNARLPSRQSATQGAGIGKNRVFQKPERPLPSTQPTVGLSPKPLIMPSWKLNTGQIPSESNEFSLAARHYLELGTTAVV
jgi:hypothetical protein